jgi:hypothetical protein
LKIADYVTSWRPSRGWASTIAPAAETIERDPNTLDALGAWCQIAMMLGDSGAAPLALIVCLHAEATAPPKADLARLHAHRNLCLLDLGLAKAEHPGPVRIGELDRIVPAPRTPELEHWLRGQLDAFDQDLARAAQFVLALVLERMGLAH